MTTVIYADQDFVACDSKWACEDSLLSLHDHYINKYVYFTGDKSDYIAFFAGDEYPIVAYQALYQKAISNDDFFRYSTEQAELNLSVEWLIVDKTSGAYVNSNAMASWFFDVRYLGTGGEHAAHFFHYSKRVKYRSIYENNVVGAMKYAYYKDPKYSGHPHNLKSWNPKYPINNTVDNNHHMYRDVLISRLGELNMNNNGGHAITELPVVAKLSPVKDRRMVLPPLKTTPSNSAPKVTVSSAISMMNFLNTL
ncbi:TPA: hypothetical protein PCJ20_005190 [Klebsiella quasipneumoniae]|uniref:hypothetical protein n=2 Tax=Klebsiella pneumoniae TaxID=573 RepID=UPI001F2659FB|nr:hypothetical protein [Klebsiella pneumoniae]HBR1084786.1 hypothetical protein [Klebsiella quasipneumoniae subsp. similipneumoniae]HDG7723305.1 hypothetical protein [Klebsiella quasipneumoniae]MCF2280653.1 hypothetical protein [Klebsiella pneumoniae]WJH49489.1 hypothetical protein FEZ16_26755 [Klebsiella pneumoniae]HBR2333632.1 hypothetical protein [Klebsiella pneumoniae]